MPDEPLRCGVCGKLHPLITICPFIKEQTVRQEFALVDGKRRMVANIMTTKYYKRTYAQRPNLDEASIVSLEESSES